VYKNAIVMVITAYGSGKGSVNGHNATAHANTMLLHLLRLPLLYRGRAVEVMRRQQECRMLCRGMLVN